MKPNSPHCLGTPPRIARRHGQAMVELVAAVVCILIVVVGLLQLVLMGTANTDSMVEATALAAGRATAAVALPETPGNLAGWDVGPDTLEQTKDDAPIQGSLMGVQQSIAGATAPGGDWSALAGARYAAIAELHHGALPSSTLGLVHGEASREVEVLPAAQALFGLRNPTEMANEVWMTVTGGLY